VNVRLASVAARILAAVVAAALYGAVNDLVVAALAPEYFGVLKGREFAVVLDRLGLRVGPVHTQAVAIGIIGSWWVGLWCGAALSLASSFGAAPPLSTRRFLRALLLVMLVTMTLSVSFGATAYAVQPHVAPERWGWIALWGIHDVRSVYAAGWWHTGAYAGSLAGTLAAVACAVASRRTRA
jgi:hypothetical protein